MADNDKPSGITSIFGDPVTNTDSSDSFNTTKVTNKAAIDHNQNDIKEQSVDQRIQHLLDYEPKCDLQAAHSTTSPPREGKVTRPVRFEKQRPWDGMLHLDLPSSFTDLR